MKSNNFFSYPAHEHIEINHQERYYRKNQQENNAIKKINNNKIDRIKIGKNENKQSTTGVLTDHSYDKYKSGGANSNYVRRNQIIQNEAINNNKQIINNNNTRMNIINNKNNVKSKENEIIKAHDIIYYSEKEDKNINKNKIKGTSSYKNNKNYDNIVILNNRKDIKSKIDEKNLKNRNRIELDGDKNRKSNLILVNSNKNTSFKIINKTKTNYSNFNTENENNRIKKRNENKELYISENNMENLSNCYEENYLNEKEYKFSKHSTKLPNNKGLMQMSNFEITYESDKGERNAHKNYIKNKTNGYKKKDKISNKYKYNNVYYSKINLDENDENLSEDNKMNNSNNPYKFQIVHNNSINKDNFRNFERKRININDSIELKDLKNNKSVSIVSNNKDRKIKKEISYINSRPTKNKIDKYFMNYNKNNNNNDIDDSNSNDNYIGNNHLNKNIFTNISIENPITINSQSNICKKKSGNNSNDYKNNHNNYMNITLNKIKKKEGYNTNKIVKYKSDYKKSDIKKIILIQSFYRRYYLRIKLQNQIFIFLVYNEMKSFIELLYNKIYIRKIKYWKYFIEKIINKIAEEIKSDKRKRKLYNNNNNTNTNKNNRNSLYNTNNKLILKTNEINKLHKELGDSFNIINEKNNGLKNKLDEMIKENTELKNQIYDNKNMEERYQQLLVENKKNQNINSIIMKDNQQLAKKLKNIQENRNNQLVIQNQSSLNMAYEDNLLKQSLIKLKYLYLKSLVFKKILKNRNFQKKYFTKYRDNVKKIKNYKIENNNIFINNKKKINIQMTSNSTLNFISQFKNNKNYLLYKIVLRKEKTENKILSKYFYNYYYKTKFMNNADKAEEEKMQKIEENKQIKKSKLLKSIIDKYKRNALFLYKKTYNEWKLRSVILKIKGAAKEMKKKRKMKKKIRDKMAKESLNNLKNKTAMFRNTHEFSYKIDKTDINNNKKEEKGNDMSFKKGGKENKDISEGTNKEKEEDKKENNNNDGEQEDYSEESFVNDE